MNSRVMSPARWALCVVVISAPLHAQSLASRIAAAHDSAVTFHFAARRGVCGDGRHFMRMGASYRGAWSNGSRSTPCDTGPVQVRLTMRDGDVTRVETWVGTLRTHDARDLGQVSAVDGSRYFLGVAAHGTSGASAAAILPAVLADSSLTWPALLAVARDSVTRTHATRQEATFWLSRFAASALAGKGHELLDDEPDERGANDSEDLKRHAVFVLSQLPNREGVPALLDIARSNPDNRVRGQALFWLGQSGDPRAIALFESLLRA